MIFNAGGLLLFNMRLRYKMIIEFVTRLCSRNKNAATIVLRLSGNLKYFTKVLGKVN